MIIKEPFMHTKLDIWYPKYSTQYTNLKERVVLLAKYKVDAATPIIIVNFTKAKHLIGQRYAIHKSHAQSFPVVKNGKIEVYEVPMSVLDTWQKEEE